MRTHWYTLPVVLMSLASARQPDDSRVAITYRGYDAYRDPALVSVTLGEGRSSRHIEGKTFTQERGSMPGDRLWAHFGPVPVATHGELPVRIDLVTSAGDTLSSVRASLQLQPHYDLSINIFAGYAPRPRGMCVAETHAAPIRNGARGMPADSMFVLIAGLPIGAVC